MNSPLLVRQFQHIVGKRWITKLSYIFQQVDENREGKVEGGEGIDRLQRAISPMVLVKHTLGKLVSQDGDYGQMSKVPPLYLSLDIACTYKEVGL